MGRNLKAFIECANIAHYVGLLESEADPVKRALLVKLLNEEKAKQGSNGVGVVSRESCPT